MVNYKGVISALIEIYFPKTIDIAQIFKTYFSRSFNLTLNIRCTQWYYCGFGLGEIYDNFSAPVIMMLFRLEAARVLLVLNRDYKFICLYVGYLHI